MKQAVVIGKNKTIETYPRDFHKNLKSMVIGMNDVFVDLDTEYGFAGHDVSINRYISQMKNIDNVIIVNPTFEGTKWKIFKKTIDNKIYAAGELDADIYRLISKSDEHLHYYINAAKNKENIPYPNYNTVLFNVLYWLIKNDTYKVYLCGCNLLGEWTDTISHASVGEVVRNSFAYARQHLDRFILIAKEYGIEIILCEDYTHFLDVYTEND